MEARPRDLRIVAAAIALTVAKFGAPRYVADFKGADPSGRSKFPLSFDASYRPPWRLLVISFGAGLVLLALELIWFRFLRLYVVSSPTAFAVMLAVVLAGIGLGSIAAGATRPIAWSRSLRAAIGALRSRWIRARVPYRLASRVAGSTLPAARRPW